MQLTNNIIYIHNEEGSKVRELICNYYKENFEQITNNLSFQKKRKQFK